MTLEETMIARLLRELEATRAVLDKLVRAVLLDEQDAVKRISVLALERGEAGGNGETWRLARDWIKDHPLPPSKPQPAPSNLEEVLQKAAERR